MQTEQFFVENEDTLILGADRFIYLSGNNTNRRLGFNTANDLVIKPTNTDFQLEPGVFIDTFFTCKYFVGFLATDGKLWVSNFGSDNDFGEIPFEEKYDFCQFNFLVRYYLTDNPAYYERREKLLMRDTNNSETRALCEETLNRVIGSNPKTYYNLALAVKKMHSVLAEKNTFIDPDIKSYVNRVSCRAMNSRGKLLKQTLSAFMLVSDRVDNIHWFQDTDNDSLFYCTNRTMYSFGHTIDTTSLERYQVDGDFYVRMVRPKWLTIDRGEKRFVKLYTDWLWIELDGTTQVLATSGVLSRVSSRVDRRAPRIIRQRFISQERIYYELCSGSRLDAKEIDFIISPNDLSLTKVIESIKFCMCMGHKQFHLNFKTNDLIGVHGHGFTRDVFHRAQMKFQELFLETKNHLTRFNKRFSNLRPEKIREYTYFLIHALCNQQKNFLEFRLPLGLQEKLLGRKFTMTELEYFAMKEDPQMFRRMKALSETDKFSLISGFDSLESAIRTCFWCESNPVHDIVAEVFKSVESFRYPTINAHTLDYWFSGKYLINREEFIGNICFDNKSDQSTNNFANEFYQFIRSIGECDLGKLIKNWSGSTIPANTRYYVRLSLGSELIFSTCTLTLTLPKELVQNIHTEPERWSGLHQILTQECGFTMD